MLRLNARQRFAAGFHAAMIGLLPWALAAAAAMHHAPAHGATSPEFHWAAVMSGSETSGGESVVVDRDGNVYASGTFSGSMDVDPGPGTHILTADEWQHTFLVKYDTSGQLVWAQTLARTTSVATSASKSVLDRDDNIHLALSYRPDPSVSPDDPDSMIEYDTSTLVVKIDSDGNELWSRGVKGPNFSGRTFPHSIAVDDDGNVYCTGSFQGTVDFDPGEGVFELTSTLSAEVPVRVMDAFVLKLDRDGNFVWVKHFPGDGDDSGLALAHDSDGNVYVAGQFRKAIELDDGPEAEPVTTQSDFLAFLVKLDPDGGTVWSRVFESTVATRINGLALDGEENLLATGAFHGTADFDPGPESHFLTTAFGSDAFVLKLDPDGHFVWVGAFSGDGHNFGFDIAVDDTGAVYSMGHFRNTADFDPGPDTFAIHWGGNVDAYISKLNSDGEFLWARAIQGLGVIRGERMALDAEAHVYVTGHFWSPADFDTGSGSYPVTGVSATAAFLVKLMGPISITPPHVVSITPETTGPTNADAVAFEVVFNEAVRGFDGAAEVVIEHNGTQHAGVSISGEGAEYTATATGISGDGTFTLAINIDGNVTDLYGNPLESSVTSIPVQIDQTPPTIAITTDFGNGPGEDFTTGIAQFQLEGVTDPETVEVRAGGQGFPRTPGSTEWSVPLDLVALGPVAALAVVAVDAAGNESDPAFITITYDPAHDADNDGLTDQEEVDIADVIPADPLDPLLPRQEWFVSAVNGDDALAAIDGGGTPSNPWRTIGRAMEQLSPLARENFPLHILLDDAVNASENGDEFALYEEEGLAFIPYVTVEPAQWDGTIRVHIRPAGISGLPVVQAAHHAALRRVAVEPDSTESQGVTLLAIDAVAFTVEQVVFDGRSRQDSVGILITGPDSSESRIRQSLFTHLATGILSRNSGAAVSDNTFEHIGANSAAPSAIRLQSAAQQPLNLTPAFGSADEILETGFNRFRDLAPGVTAMAFDESPLRLTVARYNDWGVYTEAEILDRIQVPTGASGTAVSIEPFIPLEKRMEPGRVTGVMLNAATRGPIALGAAPGVVTDTSIMAMADAHGFFHFDDAPGATRILTGRAFAFDDTGTKEVAVPAGLLFFRAPRLLLAADTAPPHLIGDINRDGVVDAIDVQLAINAALGIPINPSYDADVNGDGQVNAVDVQIVINAALGLLVQ